MAESKQSTELTIDFAAPAELFPCRYRKNKRAIAYRRFDTAAEAIRFAIEELPAPLLTGSFLDVQDQRFDGHAMRALYERDDYPLQRTVRDQEDRED
jgi:hypothetical protein